MVYSLVKDPINFEGSAGCVSTFEPFFHMDSKIYLGAGSVDWILKRLAKFEDPKPVLRNSGSSDVTARVDLPGGSLMLDLSTCSFWVDCFSLPSLGGCDMIWAVLAGFSRCQLTLARKHEKGATYLLLRSKHFSFSCFSGCCLFPLLKKFWSEISVVRLCLALAAWDKTFELQ